MEQNKYLDIVCQVMNAAIKGEHLDLSDYVNDKEFLRIMEEQTFQPFLYKVDKRPEFRKYYIQASLINDKFDKIGNKIKEIFDANSIDHIFLKGFELKKLYPDQCIRQMGDIDVLVREDDYEKAKNILKSNLFAAGESKSHHTDFSFNGINIELHNKLMDVEQGFQLPLINPFNNSNLFNKHTYKLNDSFNLLFLLFHYIKHLKRGAGLREICDFYLFFNRYEIDIDYIVANLSQENVEKFWSCLLSEINYIFSWKKYEYTENKHIEEIISYSLNSGIHGFGKEQIFQQKEFKKLKENKFFFLVKKLFIPLSRLFKIYPWTKSIILIPIGYVCRLIHLLSKRRNELKIILKTDMNDDILKKMGIE